MSEILREEFNSTMNRLFDKIDSNQKATNESILDLTVQVTQLSTRFSDLDIPEIPDRPCIDFLDHLSQHKEILVAEKELVNSWRKPIIVGVVCTMFMFVQRPIVEFIEKLFK